MNEFRVLMYHGISNATGEASALGTDDPAYTISSDQFTEQLDYLGTTGLPVISLADCLASQDAMKPAVVLTFDDGNRSDALTALPMLLARGFSATFYVTTAWIGQRGFLTEHEVRELALAGMEIGSHGHSHRFLDELTETEVAEELATSLSILRRLTGKPVGALGLPGGRTHPSLREIAAANGVSSIVTSRPGVLQADGDCFSIPRMPIQSSTTTKAFAKIVNADAAYYRTQGTRKVILDSAKRLLGNKRYEKMRNLLVSNR